ncbi:MAG TPA: cellulose biosynthesis protein BcsS [Vicinamibacterales bacterium]
MRLKFPLPASAAVAAALFVTLAAPPAASAQTAPRVTFTPVAAPSSPTAPSLSQTADGSYWEVIGGLEFDTDGMMYGFFGPQWNRPLNDNVTLTARAYANWLQYEFEENGGTTEVSGPGISTQVGLKFGDRNTFKVGAGPSFKWRGETFTDAAGNETEFDSDMEVGLSVGADAFLNPTDLDNVHAIVNYDTADDYLWSRLGYKHQITNHSWQDTWTHYAGAEGILQGNDDIRTLMLGGLVEFLHAPSRTSMMLRAGFKRSSFDTADDRSGPYFGINFYKRLGQ